MRIIRGKFGRRRFDVPSNITARPTTDFARENIFNVLENLIDFEGARCLDLFGGTGAISFEFLSRGAEHVTTVEKASTQYNFIKKVAGILGVEKELTLIKGDVFRFLAACSTPFDLVFADPPYDMEGFEETPHKILNSKAVKPGTLVVVEHNSSHDFSSIDSFLERRSYGSVNFSIFRVKGSDD